uniref:Zinc finger ZPR1-type domain-containing protein n=1 Tax=Noctiluca scintillans TaxID=2966 RepID=A0A7S1FJQ6_NOCSC
MLAAFKANVSHQEIERILNEVEKWHQTLQSQTGEEWLPLESITNFLFTELGYEDMDEFEDAISGTFPDFLSSFPHIDVKKLADGSDGEEKWACRVRIPQPGPPQRLTVTITSSAQLLETALYKAPDAILEIPSLEWTMGASMERQIDSLYNHLAHAREDLDLRTKGMVGDNPERQSAIQEAVVALGKCLDVEEPFDVVVTDPAGLSEFSCSEGVVVEQLPQE